MKYISCILRLYLLIITNFSLADSKPPLSGSESPKIERYCEPTTNLNTISEMKTYTDQLNKIDAKNPNEMEIKPFDKQRSTLMNNLNESSKKLKCTYRIINK
ncbi:MAG: hypothetical protein V4525_07990 [Pseudomonadota bacterium]